MSELLDAFDDEGLTDPDTRQFLVEALANAEASDWRDILEPFVQPERSLAVLESVPNVLQRSAKAFATGADVKVPAVDPLALAFLFVLPGGVVAACGLHTAARCSRLCRSAHELFVPETPTGALFWQRRAEEAAERWRPWRLELSKEGSWRRRYFELMRPRLDGIYVAECRFQRWVRVGHHSDLRKNAAALAAHGGRGGTGEWMHYRRYVRLMPPGQDGCLRALVLQDPCPHAIAERVLTEGVDPETHENPTKPEAVLSEGMSEGVTDAGRLRKRICAGRCQYSHEERRLEIRYHAGDGDFFVALCLGHGGPHDFAGCLDWSAYTRTDSTGEALEFNLGRLPEWKGGGLADEKKDHFPTMRFRPKLSLEHLLW